MFAEAGAWGPGLSVSTLHPLKFSLVRYRLIGVSGGRRPVPKRSGLYIDIPQEIMEDLRGYGLAYRGLLEVFARTRHDGSTRRRGWAEEAAACA